MNLLPKALGFYQRVMIAGTNFFWDRLSLIAAFVWNAA
jgi:hypothetical protein